VTSYSRLSSTEFALYYLSSMSFGAVVAVAYFSPTVSTWFEDASPKPAPSANE